MPEFTCSVCGDTFTVPDQALKKYPGWEPRYCRTHSPPKNRTSPKKKKGAKKSGTGEMNLPVEEVLSRFHSGPDTGLFTDGGARPNPGPGGWGVVHVQDSLILDQKYGHDPDTTNNRMELTALIKAYEMLPTDAETTIYCDSNLCVNIVNEWAPGWKRKGWKKKSGPIKNLALVKRLFSLAEAHSGVELKWIKAHNGWVWNEYADSLATAWARDSL